MRHVLLSIASLLLSYGLLLMANGMFGTLLGLRTQIEGFSTETIGFISAGYFLGLLLGAQYAVRVVAAVGHIRAFAAFASMMSVTALVHVLWINPFAWFGMRLVSGLCMAGMIMVTESWINERASNETRGQILSLYMITNYFSAGLGQFIVPMADPGVFVLFSIASILFSMALLPVLLTRASAPQPARPDPIHIRRLYRVSPVGFIGSVCAGLMNATFYGLGPVFAKGVGLSVAQISVFMASVIMGGLLLQWPVGRLSDRMDRRWVLSGVAFLTALAAIGILVAVGQSPGWLYLAGVVFGGLTFTLYSLSSAHTNDFADPAQRVQTAGGLLIAYGMGAVAGPIMAAAYMGRVGPEGMFHYTALIAAGLALFTLYRMTRRRAPAKEETPPFRPRPEAPFSSEEIYTQAIAPGDGQAPRERTATPD